MSHAEMWETTVEFGVETEKVGTTNFAVRVYYNIDGGNRVRYTGGANKTRA